ncbi:MAG: EthD family reductase [Marmoricola sp.]
MHRFTVQYAVPQDPAAFDRAYTEEHVPLVRDLPGLAAFTLSHPEPAGGEKSVYLVAQLDFPDAAAMQEALRSDAMAAAGRHAASLGVPTTMFSGAVEDIAL